MDPGAFMMLVPLAGMATGGVFIIVIYRLASRWMDRKRLPEGDLADEVDRLRGEVDALRDVALRVDELEERLDFAERLLAQRQPDRLRSEG